MASRFVAIHDVHVAETEANVFRREALERLSNRVLLQLRVFGFSLLVDRDVGISILPECKKVVIGLARGYFVARHYLSPGELQMGKRAVDAISYQARMSENLLQLDRCLLALSGLQVGFCAYIGWKNTGK